MTTFNENLLNKGLFDSLDQFYTDLLLKSCQGRQTFLWVARTTKSCSKVTEHNLFIHSHYHLKKKYGGAGEGAGGGGGGLGILTIISS